MNAILERSYTGDSSRPDVEAAGGGRFIPPFLPVATAAGNEGDDERGTQIWRMLPKLPDAIRN
jgi:hypothetical protein